MGIPNTHIPGGKQFCLWWKRRWGSKLLVYFPSETIQVCSTQHAFSVHLEREKFSHDKAGAQRGVTTSWGCPVGLHRGGGTIQGNPSIPPSPEFMAKKGAHSSKHCVLDSLSSGNALRKILAAHLHRLPDAPTPIFTLSQLEFSKAWRSFLPPLCRFPCVAQLQ